MAGEVEAHPAGRRVPDPHERPVAGRSNPLAVGADRHAPDFVVVPVEGEDSLTLGTAQRSRVPDDDLPVVACRGETPAVRAERHAPAHIPVSEQAEYLSAGRRVPEVDRLVLPGRGEESAV